MCDEFHPKETKGTAQGYLFYKYLFIRAQGYFIAASLIHMNTSTTTFSSNWTS
jgi:hypothetical protein